jgi:hypothetical protein
MELKDFLKTTEALVVLLGLFLAVVLGKFWAIATAIVYVLINVPKLWDKLKQLYKDKFKNRQ